MASHQRKKDEAEVPGLTQGGTGPEYDYPTTKDNEPVAVLPPSDKDFELTEDDPAAAPGEDAPPLKDDEIAREERLEDKEAGVWTEDLAENEPRPGEGVYDPDMEPAPSDLG